MTTLDIVEQGTILRGTVGSTVHGLHRGGERSRVMAVRRGERSFEEVLAEIGEVEQRLEAALERMPLREMPDDDTVNAFLVDAYRRAWGW